MKKSLSELSLDELWELFPIVLKEHNPEYKKWYQEESESLCSLLPRTAVFRISHIGSTAVEGLTAKPTVDILLELTPEAKEPDVTGLLAGGGWLLMSRQESPEWKLSFNKGYTPEGYAKRVFHLHVRRPGDWGELYFRDYLSAHPEEAQAYGALKMRLWKEFGHDRDGYTDAKTEFVTRVTQAARQSYSGRYRVPSQNCRL